MAQETSEQRRWRLRNQAVYRERNREELRARGVAYREANREALVERDMRERQRDPDGYKVKRREYARRYRDRINAIILKAKTQPCADCGEIYPAQIMQFDHVMGIKRFTVSHWQKVRVTGTGKSREQLVLEEIAKCEIRCPTCHELRHYQERRGNDTLGGPHCPVDDEGFIEAYEALWGNNDVESAA